jgi:GT2 family glycosyltransferase
MPLVDVLIPTRDRPAALAVTLTSVMAQTHARLRVTVSDQSADPDALTRSEELVAVLRVLRQRGVETAVLRHVPRLGLAEHRHFLLGHATAPYVLFLDDDVILEPDLIERLVRVIRREGCGFVGSAVVGLSYSDDVRPHEQAIELWDGPVAPERVEPGSPAWSRSRVHNAANLLHVARELGVKPTDDRVYRVAWTGGCVLYDREKLLDIGGFAFWQELPTLHAGEDVVAQLRVMARYGGCGIIPSGAYHQELPTTVPDRQVDAPWVL